MLRRKLRADKNDEWLSETSDNAHQKSATRHMHFEMAFITDHTA